MSHHRARTFRHATELTLVITVAVLLAFVPACSFIEGLIGGGDESTPAADAGAVVADGAAANTPQPPPLVPPPGVPDASAIAAAVQNAQGAQLPPGFDPSKLPPGFDPANLPPGFDPTKLPPGIDPTKLADAGVPPGIPTQIPDGGLNPAQLPPGIDPSKLPPGFDPSKLPPGVDPAQLANMDPSKLPPGVDPADLAGGGAAGMPPQLAALPPEQQAQLSEALAARQKLIGQIRRLDYIIDRNMTKNPADVVRLNRYVRAKREIDARLEAMRKEHNIPREAFDQMINSSGGSGE